MQNKTKNGGVFFEEEFNYTINTGFIANNATFGL